MLPDPMIETHGLARSFKTKTGPVAAVQGIDFEVRPGQIVGLLGPNGAGKTTTLRMLTTLLRPTTGSATVAGVDLRADPREVRRRIGYVAQIGATPAPGTILGEELVAQARLQGMSKADATSRLTELLQSSLGDEFLAEDGAGRRGCPDLGDIADPPPDLARVRTKVDAGDGRRTGGRTEQGGEHAQRRGLARTVGSEQTDDLPGADLEVDALHGSDGAGLGLERAGQAVRLDHRVGEHEYNSTQI